MTNSKYGESANPSDPAWTYMLDADPIHTFNDAQKMAWVRGRLEKTLLVPLRDAEIRTRFGREPIPAYDLNLGMMTLACCAVEALGRFLLGGSKSQKCDACGQSSETPSASKCFREFVKEYMSSYYGMSRPLYGSYRCGLAHSLAIRDGSLASSLGMEYVKGNSTSPHLVDYDRFIKDLDTGIDRYFNDLRNSPDLRADFLRHWNREYGFWCKLSRLKSGQAS